MKNVLHAVKALDGDMVHGANRVVTIAAHVYTLTTDRDRRLEVRIKGLREGVAQLGSHADQSLSGKASPRASA